jgi:transcriptional regulator with XRE-family HTH domain
MSRKKSSQLQKKYGKNEIGRRIRQLRGFDMNQEEFGKKLGISQSMVSRLEKGEIPSVELLLRISEVCRKPTDWILKGE